jgi:peptidoglycan glycosyltransferase
VLASVSYPDYDPNTVADNWEELNSDDSAPLLDRSRQTLLAPGSTFKVVTLTGAYANETITDEETFPAPASMDIGNAPVTNFERSGYSRMNIVTATQKSVNTVYGQVAVLLGADKLVEQAAGYGFGQDIPFDLGIETSLMPDPAEMTEWETAWAGIGQPVGEHESPAGPQATVYQMALVAAGIGNDGTVMRPYVVDHVSEAHNSDSILGKTSPQTWLQATTKAVADHVTESMAKVVEAGSGVRAQISGVDVAGKTGTAEVGDDVPTNAWFIGFAPANNPQVAIAVLVEGGGQGGQTAAPTAKPVIEAALAVAGGAND